MGYLGFVLSFIVLVANADYNRKNWRHWIDVDRDCQNTRQEMLITQSQKEVVFKTDRGCTVLSGLWFDPYSNKMFKRASNVDIDHVVPLKEAYLSGGKDWSRFQKRRFANDTQNLLIVSARLNRQKGAKDPARWLPPKNQCFYVNLWVGIKNKYGLKMDSTEKSFIAKKLKSCQSR